MRFLKKSKGFKVGVGVLLVLMIFLLTGYKYISARCSASKWCGRQIGLLWCSTFGHCEAEYCFRVMDCVYSECWTQGGPPAQYMDCCSWY